MKIKQRIPNFVDGVPETSEFNTTKQLKKLKFVKRWSKDKEFLRYSISGDYLMAELNEGTVWYVIGTIFGDTKGLDLPEFKPIYDTPEKTENRNMKHKDIKYQEWMG